MAWKEYRVAGRTFYDYSEALEYAHEIALKRSGGKDFSVEYAEGYPEVEELGLYHKLQNAGINIVALVIVLIFFATVATMCVPRWMTE